MCNMEEREWLAKQLANELDLISCSEKNSRFIYRDEKPIAHYSIVGRGGIKELTTVLVDPEFRGQGLSYEILEHCTEKTCVFTKNPALVKALEKSGFKSAWWPGFIPFIIMMFDRAWRLIKMILSLNLRRCLHQCRHLFSYRMFIRN